MVKTGSPEGPAKKRLPTNVRQGEMPPLFAVENALIHGAMDALPISIEERPKGIYLIATIAGEQRSLKLTRSALMRLVEKVDPEERITVEAKTFATDDLPPRKVTYLAVGETVKTYTDAQKVRDLEEQHALDNDDYDPKQRDEDE